MRDDGIGNIGIDRITEEDDPILEETRIDIIGSFLSTDLIDDRGDEEIRDDFRFFWFCLEFFGHRKWGYETFVVYEDFYFCNRKILQISDFFLTFFEKSTPYSYLLFSSFYLLPTMSLLTDISPIMRR